MRLFNRVIILSVALIVIACDDKNVVPPTPGYNMPYPEEETAKISPVTLECDSADCPESITHIRIGRNESCSGTLVGRNKVVTAGHCFKNFSFSKCSETKLYFRKRDGVTYESKCRRLEGRFVEGKSALKNVFDFAEIEIDTDHDIRPMRTSVMSSMGIGSVVTTDYENKRKAKIVIKKNCKILNNHIHEENSALKIASRCQVFPGNSGGAFTNSNGSLQGIIIAKIRKDDFSFMKDQLMSFPRLEDYSIILDYECVRDSGFCGRQIPVKERSAMIVDKFIEFHNKLNDKLDTPELAFTYSLTGKYIKPLCVHHAKNRFERIKENSSWSNYLRGNYQEKIVMSVPFQGLELKLNNDLLPELDFAEAGNSISIQEIVLDYSDFKSTGLVIAEARGDAFESRVFTNTFSLPTCDFPDGDIVSFMKEVRENKY